MIYVISQRESITVNDIPVESSGVLGEYFVANSFDYTEQNQSITATNYAVFAVDCEDIIAAEIALDPDLFVWADNPEDLANFLLGKQVTKAEFQATIGTFANPSEALHIALMATLEYM